jgi:large subunit ribosomal protein L21
MHAVIKTGGKQYRVEPGDEFNVEKLGEYESGDTVEIDDVLACGDGEDMAVGRPMLEDVAVEAEVVEHGLGEKKIVFKKKRKEGYRKKQGHRQPYTRIRITDISQ